MKHGKSILKFFHKQMFPMILALIVPGTVGGLVWHPLFVALKPTIPWALFLMLYPMMIGLSLGQFAEIGRKPRDTLLASLFPRWKHIFERRRAETPSLT